MGPKQAVTPGPIQVDIPRLRRLAATEAARGSYDEARSAVLARTGVGVGKRQLEALALATAVDFEAFYRAKDCPAAAPGEVIVISVDGKGVVMRPEALRKATAKAAANTSTKLKGRLSKGEKANRKRTPEDVMARTTSTNQTPTSRPAAPRAAHKWVTASVADDAKQVIAEVFDQADRRDPGRRAHRVALVDGNRHQIDRITAEAKARG